MKHQECSLNYGWTHDVFVSFHGEDTRYNFTGNLCNALHIKGINTFKDDIKLMKGEGISKALIKAIDGSRIAIIVFSENYASSTWCLDELVKIIECMKEKGQLVRPVFYYVDPSNVRHQRGSFRKSMAKHEENPKITKERLSKWRIALFEAASLSGWHFQNGYEFELIQKITEEVSSKLNLTPLHIAYHPVGLNYRMSQVVSLLEIRSSNNDDDVFMVGIYGIGGIGKTTLARAVYNSIARNFEGSSFLADVRENSMKHGLVQLQETLLFNLLGENIKLSDVNKGIPIITRRLGNKKVLLILDDVDNLQQLRSLAGRHDWFGLGSRIIITTRDKQLLAAHGAEKLYEVKELNDQEALELFSFNAFRKKVPDESYVKIANHVVQYAKGHPLALNVIGSDLFGKTIQEWESALKKYETIPNKEILNVLKVSYDNLDDNEKEIFLDIACFFKGYLKEDVEKTLDASRFFSKYGIGVLVDKSLVTIGEANTIKMHDLIQDLGKNISRKESPFDPSKRRRLWHYKDALEVLTENTGTDTIEGIVLDMPNMKQDVQLNANTFGNMRKLRILIVRNAHVSGAPQNLPNNLRLLEWNQYPSTSLPANFHPKTLVVLNLPKSRIAMDEPFKKFEQLTYMNFSDCDSLTKLPDVSAVPNLTRILVNDCPNLVDIHDSVGDLEKLITLSTQGCPKLNSFPTALRSKSLEYLNLRKCYKIQSFPDVLAKVENMKNIDIGETAIKKFPSSIENFKGLEQLVLASCPNFEDLPSNTDMFQNIEELNVEGCPQLPKLLWKSLENKNDWLPKLSNLSLKNCNLSDKDLELILKCFLQLKWLILSDNIFLTIPDSVEDLSHLLLLNVENCKHLRDVSVLPTYLQYIDARNCMALTPQSSEVILSQAFQEIEYIDIVVPRTKIPSWFDHCSKGGSVEFWFRQKFPAIALFFLLSGEDERKTDYTCEYCLLINGIQVFQARREWPVDHVWLFDLRIHLTASEWKGFNEQIKSGWNHVEISCYIINEPKNATTKCCGIHLYKDRMNIHHVSFISPDLHGSNMSYDNDHLDIYDEERKDVVFNTMLAKYLNKNILEAMEFLQSNKSKDDSECDYDEELELDSDINDCEEEFELHTDSQQMEEEQYSASFNHQILEEFEFANKDERNDTNSRKILPKSSTETLEEALNSSIHMKEPLLAQKAKLKENKNFAPESSSILSINIDNKGAQLGDKITSEKGEKINIESTIIQESTDIVESTINEEKMETFYASLEAEKTSTLHVAVRANLSAETQKALQILQDFASKKFSLLMHPGRSGLMKDILKYLISLPPDEGLSLKTKSLIQQLSHSFSQWFVDYNNANIKLESATEELSKAERVKNDLEANVKDFKEMDMVEKCLYNQLACLQKEKRDLEEKINVIKAEIADYKAQTDMATKRKAELFRRGRVMKIERDDLRNQVPRLRAEQEWAKITQANIEAEWLKLGEQFIGSTSLNEWT